MMANSLLTATQVATKPSKRRRGFYHYRDKRERMKQQLEAEGQEAAKREKEMLEEEFEVGIFTVTSANKTMRDAAREKDPIKLYDELWYEGEMCCLFADSNVGKSIYAVQIATEIAKAQRVLYFDFELSNKQFQLRYQNGVTKEQFKFPRNFYRVCMKNITFFNADELTNKILFDIEDCVKKTGAKVIIIDNLTWIANNARSASVAGILMERLTALKKQYRLSMLILAHTKKRNMSKPIGQNDLGGSKMLFNFMDSSFSIGISARDPQIRFIKQVKVRNDGFTYDENNVMVCHIDKKDKKFLQFITDGYEEESVHLKKLKETDKQILISQVKMMVAEGKSLRDIATDLGISLATAQRYSKK